MTYYNSVTWECRPGEIEVLVNTTAYFIDSKTYRKSLDAATEEERRILKVVDQIWRQYDVDNSGALDKDETRKFIEDCYAKMPENNYDDSQFDEIFE